MLNLLLNEPTVNILYMNYNLKKLGLSLILLVLVLVSCKDVSTNKETTEAPLTNLYQEKHRPQIHFTPEANWMNDPNGMFYFKGKYHLFYQYYPDSTVWGPMHWGHAETEDLVHWKHLPIGLYPDSIGCIFSGGAVVDHDNTSNLGSAEIPAIIATFTHHDFKGEKAKTNDFQKQSIAYSLDGGYEWIKYPNNPVIPNTEKIKDFRDPKVVWNEDAKQWILTLAAYDKVKFYTSKNLIDWKHVSDFGIEGDHRLWECPDLIPMNVEGTDQTKWVLIVSIQKDAPNGGTATSYFVGDFNGKEFKSDVKTQKWLDWGTDNYAFVTWNSGPKNDERIIGLGWMSNWQYAQNVPTENWRSSMTLPRELKLLNVNNEFQVYSYPIKEMNKLRGESTSFTEMKINKGKELKGVFDASQAEYNFEINLNKTSAESFGLKFQNDIGEYFLIQFNKKDSRMYVDRRQSGKNRFSKEFYKNLHSAPINFDGNSLSLRLIMDVSSSELFINKGALSFTSIFFPTKDFNKISLFAKNGTLEIPQAKVFELESIWN